MANLIPHAPLQWIRRSDGIVYTDSTRNYRIALLNDGNWELEAYGEIFRVGTLAYCRGQAEWHRERCEGECRIFRTDLDLLIEAARTFVWQGEDTDATPAA